MRVIVPFAITVFAYALASRRLRTSPVSAPMVFVAAGIVFEASGVSRLARAAPNADQLTRAGLVLVEVALALTLFTDAARIDFVSLKPRLALAE